MSTKAAGRTLAQRYLLCDEIAAGGMASVHLGTLHGPTFTRTVAIKRLHPHLARDPEFFAMMADEGRLSGRISHPNVVSTLDVVEDDGELFIVMDYIHGVSLSALLKQCQKRGARMPPAVAVSIMMDALLGLHAAHEAVDDDGRSLSIVHRDVSPQNILVGVDGASRITDFGVAKAISRSQTTQEGQLKGKLSYMSPEQLAHASVDRRTDIYAAGVVLWEALTGERLFRSDDPPAIVTLILDGRINAPSSVVDGIGAELDAVVMNALSREPDQRFDTAREMARALERALAPAGVLTVGDWVEHMAGDTLVRQSRALAAAEEASRVRDAGGLPPQDPIASATAATAPLGNESTQLSATSSVGAEGGTPRGRLLIAALVAAFLAALGGYALSAGDADPSLRRGLGVATWPEVTPRTEPAANPASASSATEARPTTRTPARPKDPARPRPSPKPTPKPNAEPAQPDPCNPPYVMLANGVKRWKSECF